MPAHRLVSLLLLMVSAAAVTARELSMLVPFPPHYVLSREVAGVYAERVRQASNGRLSIRLYGPDVVPAFHQLEPARAGLFDLLYAAPSYHSGDVPAAVGIGGLRPGTRARRQSGVWAAVDAIYRAHDLRLLSLPQLGTRSAQLLLTEPYHPEQALAGKKIRATLTYRRIVEQLGGIPVNMPSYDIFSSLDRGVIDGAAFGSVGVEHLQLHEVASHVVRPAFGVITALILINEDRWKTLTPAEHSLLLEAGEALEHHTVARFDELEAHERDTMLAKGMALSRLPAGTAGKLDDWFADGMWAYALRHGGEPAERLYRLAERHRLRAGSAPGLE